MISTLAALDAFYWSTVVAASLTAVSRVTVCG